MSNTEQFVAIAQRSQPVLSCRVASTRSVASETTSHPGQPPTFTRVGGKVTRSGIKVVPASIFVEVIEGV